LAVVQLPFSFAVAFLDRLEVSMCFRY